MTYASYERVRDSQVAHTVTVRTDLLVDVDDEGRVVGVERIADEVRYGDLVDVIEMLVVPEGGDD